MKLRISILLLFGAICFFSCQQEEVISKEGPQVNEIEKRDWQEAVICVFWGDNPSDPVQGAMVFDMETNELISETDGEGNVYIEPIPRVYRVVEPNYGAQQAIVIFPDDFAYDPETGKKKTPIAWDKDGNPIYE